MSKKRTQWSEIAAHGLSRHQSAVERTIRAMQGEAHTVEEMTDDMMNVRDTLQLLRHTLHVPHPSWIVPPSALTILDYLCSQASECIECLIDDAPFSQGLIRDLERLLAFIRWMKAEANYWSLYT